MTDLTIHEAAERERLAGIQFTGEIHPLAGMWPELSDDEVAALAASIAENGQRHPITLDQHGRLVDGRNRLRAAELAGVEPWFEVREFASDAEVAEYVADQNAERRHLTAGQQAMGRALMLQAQGKRRNGRWERGTFANNQDLDRSAEVALSKAGLILDTAERAAGLGDEYADWASLPAQVMCRGCTLDFAYRSALDFETKAALAEAMKTQPLTEALTRAEVVLDDLAALLPLPALDVPLTKGHRTQLADINKRARELAAQFSSYAKESK